SHLLLNEYGGIVPQTMEELVKLPGVGRKTANVVMSNAFDVPAIAVDTHVFRVSKRIGLAKGNNVLQVENDLMKNIPKEYWSRAHHWIIWHGRKLCTARNPKCEMCPLNQYCDDYKRKNKKS
ncbi:MAG: endonuclease III, partial [Eubacterium sp.]